MWLAQLVSTAGSALTDLAASICVCSKTGSALSVGLTLMATGGPRHVVGLVADVFVDRWNRRAAMVASSLGQAIVVVSIPFLLGIDTWLRFAAILANAGIKPFLDPAYEALIPELASDEGLTAASAFLQIAPVGSTAVGFAGAGLLAAIDIRLGFWIDAATFVFSAACASLMRVDAAVTPSDDDASVTSVLRNLGVGVGTVAGTPLLRSRFLMALRELRSSAPVAEGLPPAGAG